MTVADPEIPSQDFPVSHALLDHGGLMTPRLTRFFGPVHASQTDLKDEGERLLRWSTLYQTRTGAPLLQARLVIFKSALPEGFLDRLLSGNRLFGGLAIEAGLPVRMIDQHIFQTDSGTEAKATAWGRRHRVLRAEDDAPLCDVEERLEPEAVLQGLVLPDERDGLALD